MNTREQLRHILTQILNGELAAASRALTRIEPKSLVERRMHAHYQGVLHFHRGDIHQASECMENALQVHGENINLLRDLLVCRYHLNDMIGFRAGLQKFELVLIEREAELEERSLIEGELMLGKFNEEEARLAPAVLFYEKALSRSRTPPQRFRVLIHKARWQAQYDPSQELSDHYRELISFPGDQVTRDQHIELEHALMMIELRLVGADHAWQRIERLGREIAEIDHRLLVFDFIEGSLALDLPLPGHITDRIREFRNLTPYEAFLGRLLEEPKESAARIHELASLATKLPWSSYLRLLCLTANLDTHPTTRQELNRKIQLIILGLDPRSQMLWNLRLKQALQAPEIRMELSLRSRQIRIHGKMVDLSKKKIGLQLLAGLREKTSLSVDQAINLLWGSSFSPEHYHRLRMSAHRLNTLIHEMTGQGKVIEVDSQNVRLRPEVSLRCADEPNESEILNRPPSI